MARRTLRQDEMQTLIDQNLALAQQHLLVAEQLKATYQPTPVPPDASVMHVFDSEGLVEALATVTGPATILLAAGIYRGNFVLRNRDDTGLVTIRTDLPDNAIEPPGELPWITPDQAQAFATLEVDDPGLPILRCADGAHDYALVGLELRPNVARPDMTLLELGRGDVTSLDQVPHHLAVDCCYIHGDPATGCRRGVSLQAASATITRCTISDCWYQGQDAQAIAVWTSPGDLLIENNFLSGSGENVIVGGADPKIPNLVPTDITIRGNHLFKPPAWRTYHGSVKNLFELKNAKEVLIENNVFEGCWVDGQPGHAIVFTIRNQDGHAPWSTVQDVRFCWNVVIDVEGCFVNLLGVDDLHPSVRGEDMTIEQNLFVNGGGGVQSLSGFHYTTICHNATTGPDWKWLSFGGQPAEHFVYLDNAVPPTEYGITGDDCGIGVPSLERYAPGYDLRCNSIGMKGWVTYPEHNYLLDVSAPPADYLAQVASDGATVGPDLQELARRIPWYTLPALGCRWTPRAESHKTPKPFGMR